MLPKDFPVLIERRKIEKAARAIAYEIATTYSDSEGNHWIQQNCTCGGGDGDLCEFCVECDFYEGIILEAFKDKDVAKGESFEDRMARDH